MPRLARKDLKSPILHVMIQGVNKEFIFQKEEYIKKYLELMSENIKDYNIEILAYCMMNNHAHFLIYVENIDELGKAMQKVNLIFAQIYNKRENRCGVLFRNRFRTEAINSKKYLINCIKYIHNNPVKAGMVENCEDYKYSSYNDYICNRGISHNKIIKSFFGDKCDFQKLFSRIYDKRFMDIEDESEAEMNNYIIQGISEFKQQENIKIEEVFLSRKVLKNVIHYLNSMCGIKYVEIERYFEMPKGVIKNLK